MILTFRVSQKNTNKNYKGNSISFHLYFFGTQGKVRLVENSHRERQICFLSNKSFLYTWDNAHRRPHVSFTYWVTFYDRPLPFLLQWWITLEALNNAMWPLRSLLSIKTLLRSRQKWNLHWGTCNDCWPHHQALCLMQFCRDMIVDVYYVDANFSSGCKHTWTVAWPILRKWEKWTEVSKLGCAKVIKKWWNKAFVVKDFFNHNFFQHASMFWNCIIWQDCMPTST